MNVASHERQPGLLDGLAKNVIEAALEAELAEHLGDPTYDAASGTRGSNYRNGTRRKRVRTVLGPVEIDVPRDRWGTFDPMTVGKWQREVVGVDRLVLPLAAKDAPAEALVSLLSQVYPEDASPRLLCRIAATARARVASWHTRSIDPPFPALHVHLSAPPTRRGRIVGFPVLSVIGVAAADRGASAPRELLSLNAVPARRGAVPWHAVLSDLHQRGLVGVRSVVGDGSALLGDAVAGLWPGATAVAPEGRRRAWLAG